MADFPNLPYLGEPTLSVISPASMNSLGPGFATAPASGAWPTANKAILVPFRVTNRLRFCRSRWVEARPRPVTTTGVYDEYGTRLISTGAQAKPASSETLVDVSDTTIGPGLFYMALAHDGTANIFQWTLTAVANQTSWGA